MCLHTFGSASFDSSVLDFFFENVSLKTVVARSMCDYVCECVGESYPKNN